MNINGEELLLLIIIAVIVIGPERLPTYAEQLAQLVRNLKKMATGATERVKEELGEEAADLDLSQLDPRKYDPRRIVRDALADDILPASRPARPRTPGTAASAIVRKQPSEASRIARENAARRRAELQAKKQAAAAAAAAEATDAAQGTADPDLDVAVDGAGSATVASEETAATQTSGSRSTAAGTTAVSEGATAVRTSDQVTTEQVSSEQTSSEQGAGEQDLVTVGAPFDDEAT